MRASLLGIRGKGVRGRRAWGEIARATHPKSAKTHLKPTRTGSKKKKKSIAMGSHRYKSRRVYFP